MFNFFKSKPVEAAELSFKTDIHCHLAPGIDDGSADAALSADIIERMQAMGIERIFVSPHITNITYVNTGATIGAAMDKLRAELERRGNKIEISSHAEHRIDELFLSMFRQKTVQPLPGNLLLIENSFLQEPWNLDQVVFDLQVAGYRPILAHPERYDYYYRDKSRYEALHNAGLMFQINLLSLAGAYGKEERRIAEWLMGASLVDFVGTDIHGMRHVEAIEKYLHTKEAHRDMDALRGRLLNDTAL